jgi:hypothetical protein
MELGQIRIGAVPGVARAIILQRHRLAGGLGGAFLQGLRRQAVLAGSPLVDVVAEMEDEVDALRCARWR